MTINNTGIFSTLTNQQKMIFDGKKIRDEIMSDLKSRILKLKKQPVLAVIWVGEDEVTARYVEIKQRMAEKLGVHFDLTVFPASETEEHIIKKIESANNDPNIDGIMVQIPLPEHINQTRVIQTISADKDVDGLRYCANFKCGFFPPVIASIILAMEMAHKDIYNKNITVIGKGFLVGAPLIRYLEGKTKKINIGDQSTPYIGTITKDADVIISAVGKPHIIKANIVKDGVILIDAGTSEAGGALAGDVDPAAYAKASFYTPTPGGIGPVTVAMLFKNLVMAAERHK